MQKKFLSVLASLIFFINYNLPAQISSFSNTPVKFELVKLKCVSDCDIPQKAIYMDVKAFEFGCALAEGEQFRLYLKNKSQQKYFYTLLDIQPDNLVNILLPTRYEVQ